MQYVTLMIGEDFWHFRTTRASCHMKATSLPVPTGESKSLSAFMQTSVAASAAGRRGLWEMFQETFFPLFRVATFKDSPAPTGNWGFGGFFSTTWKTGFGDFRTCGGAVGPLNDVWPANVNKQRVVGLLFWRVCCNAVMSRLSRLCVVLNTLRKGIFFFFFEVFHFLCSKCSTLRGDVQLDDLFFVLCVFFLNISFMNLPQLTWELFWR